MFQSFTGMQYLKIDVANNFGKDKELWADRIGFVEENRARLRHMTPEAESPAQFTASLNALEDAEKGIASGYPIALDATASGFQWLSCLGVCRKSAETCNVVDNGKRNDTYTSLYQHMKELCGTTANIARADLKSAGMKVVYGSKAEPKRVFPKPSTLAAFFQTLKTLTPGAYGLNEYVLTLHDETVDQYRWIMPDGFDVRAKVRGFQTDHFGFRDKPAEVTYEVVKPTKHDRSLAANTVHSVDGFAVRELARRAMHDPIQRLSIASWLKAGLNDASGRDTKSGGWVQYLNLLHRDSGFLSARILQHLRRDNLGLLSDQARADLFWMVESLPANPFQVLSVHDCFRVLPNHGDSLRRQYNVILSDVARSNIHQFQVSQITGQPIKPKAFHDAGFCSDILETNYALS